MKFWHSLNTRERLIIKLGFPALFAILFYYYYWQPNLEKLESLRTEVPQLRATLAWMEHEIEAARPYLARPAVRSDGTPLLTVIDQVALKARVHRAIQRVQPGEDGSVKIWFQDVVADHWIYFIDLLTKSGISVESGNITRAGKGLASARVTVYR
jgi:general secretion pathway protein M